MAQPYAAHAYAGHPAAYGAYPGYEGYGHQQYGQTAAAPYPGYTAATNYYPGWLWDGYQWVPDPAYGASAPAPSAAQQPPLPAQEQPPLPEEPPPPGSAPVAAAPSAQSNQQYTSTNAAAAPPAHNSTAHQGYYSQQQYNGAQYTYAQPAVSAAPTSTASAYHTGGAWGAAAGGAASSAVPSAPAASARQGNQGDYSRVPPPASLTIKASTQVRPSARWGAGPAAAVPSSAGQAASASPVFIAVGPSAAAPAPALADSIQQRTAAMAEAARRAAAAATATATASAAAPAAAAKQQGGGEAILANQLPQPLLTYVKRCLESAKTTDEKAWVKQRLTALIKDYRDEQQLWVTDWDRWPLLNQGGFQGYTAAAGRLLQASPAAPARSPAGQGATGRQEQQHEEQERWRDGRYNHHNDHQQHQHQQHRGDRWGRQRDQQHSSEDEEAEDRGGRQQRRAAALAHGLEDMAVGQGRGRGKGGRGRGRGQQQQAGKGKRKKWEAEVEEDSPVWSLDEMQKRLKRNARFGDTGGAAAAPAPTKAGKGWATRPQLQHSSRPAEESTEKDWESLIIKGTSQKLEKSYFRLVSELKPEQVRPPAVIAQALQRMVGIIAERGAEGVLQCYLHYYCDQLKAMRQDLVVQHIKSELSVQVYETHARAAIEYGDFPEYNQCQTQLVGLYAAGLPGCHAEFVSYRILYQLHNQSKERYKLQLSMGQVLSENPAVGTGVKGAPQVEHALQVVEAVLRQQHRRFWLLYESAPGLSRCLMDQMVRPMRWQALNTLVRSHRPTNFPLKFLAAMLGFLLAPGTSRRAADAQAAAQASIPPGCSQALCEGKYRGTEDEPEALQACLEWAKGCGVVFDKEDDLAACVVVTKASSNLKLLEEPKVAHGDVNMSIVDFIARF